MTARRAGTPTLGIPSSVQRTRREIRDENENETQQNWQNTSRCMMLMTCLPIHMPAKKKGNKKEADIYLLIQPLRPSKINKQKRPPSFPSSFHHTYAIPS